MWSGRVLSLSPKEKLNKQSVDYDVFVKRVLVDNTEIQPLDSLGLIKETVLYEHRLVLPPRYSSVTFEIASNTLNNISNIGLEYKLEGFDNEYMKAGDNTMITYTNLHPGALYFPCPWRPGGRSRSGSTFR